MASSILPNDRSTTLPILPTDGQRFVDAQMVQWIYNGKEGIWERRGTTAYGLIFCFIPCRP